MRVPGIHPWEHGVIHLPLRFTDVLLSSASLAQLHPHEYNKDPAPPHSFTHYYKWELLEVDPTATRKENDFNRIIDDNVETN